MKVNLCIPTRGKTASLMKYVIMDIENSVLDDTRITIGIDDDDQDSVKLRPNHPKMVISVNEREDALGAKYNRCAADSPADIYVMGLDDVGIKTKGWDAILVDAASHFTDGIGAVYFGKEPHGEALPSMIAVTKRFVELQGFFCPPYFPFWWNNTWVDEVAMMAGRVIRANIETAYPDEFPTPERRDIQYWQHLFDATFALREKAADRMLEASDDPIWRQNALREARYLMVAGMEVRGACLRDPNFVAQLGEQPVSMFQPLDLRYQRLRKQASELLNSLKAA